MVARVILLTKEKLTTFCRCFPKVFLVGIFNIMYAIFTTIFKIKTLENKRR